LKIDEFISSLPSEVIMGLNITMADNVFRSIFKFSKLSCHDILYYIGFGNNVNSLKIALELLKMTISFKMLKFKLKI
jgi:hypothetical protein